MNRRQRRTDSHTHRPVPNIAVWGQALDGPCPDCCSTDREHLQLPGLTLPVIVHEDTCPLLARLRNSGDHR